MPRYDENYNESGWIMSSYISKKARTWCIFPFKVDIIYKKIHASVEYEKITEELEKHKQIISTMNKYLTLKHGKNYTNYMDNNLNI